MNVVRPSNNKNMLLHDDLNRFKAYWNQIQEVMKLNPKTVLEVGKGTGFLSRYLELLGVEVTTLDVDPLTEPDIISDIRDFDLTKKYDVVCLFEVLEHIPYQDALKVFSNLKGHARFIVLSVPTSMKGYRFLMPKIDVLISLPFKDHSPDSLYHYWELDNRNAFYFERMCILGGFLINKSYRYKENPFMYFYVLENNHENT